MVKKTLRYCESSESVLSLLIETGTTSKLIGILFKFYEIPRTAFALMAGPNSRECRYTDQADYKGAKTLKTCYIGVSSHPFGVVFHKPVVIVVSRLAFL